MQPYSCGRRIPTLDGKRPWAAYWPSRAQVARKSTLTLKVSDKGAVSLYGLGRFPLSIYAARWLKVLDMADDIRAFIEANKDKLSWK